MTENFGDLFQSSLKATEMRLGKIIKAKIISVDKDFVLLDAGLKSESVVPIHQFRNLRGEIAVNEGDYVDVVLDAIDNNYGETRLSREKAKKIETWTYLENANKCQDNVSGFIVSHVRGGYTVEIEGLRGFLPGSLVDVRPLKDISHLEDKEIHFKIVKLDVKRNNIVVSRRAVIELETQGDREALLDKLHEGLIVDGVVKNITDFGAFIDLGGIDGLLHITDMSWSRIKHPSDMLTLGDHLEVKVIRFDKEKNRISLGIKQLGEDPWKHVEEELSIGTKLIGKVTNITDYGCFVRLREGIEGLVHTSEMDWTNKNINSHNIVQNDQEIEVMVLEVDIARHRISLGIKQCNMNPWDAFATRYKPGDKVKGFIRSLTDFGIFIGLEGNIDGLIHISDISWHNSEEAIKKFKKGEEIEAVMLSIDADRQRISFGIKQLMKNPLENYVIGQKVQGHVKLIRPSGAVVDIGSGIEGFIKISDIANKHIKEVGEVLQINQKVNPTVVYIDSKRHTMYLSMKENNVSSSNSRYVLQQSGKDSDYQVVPTTIGDLIKEKLNR